MSRYHVTPGRDLLTLPTQLTFTCSKAALETLEKNTRKKRERPERRLIVNFEHMSHLFLVFLLLTLSKEIPTGKLLRWGFLAHHTTVVDM